MPVSLYLRGLPDAVHRRLVQRAMRGGMSLRQYAVQVLAKHCGPPTMQEWLADVEILAQALPKTSGAQAVSRCRKADDRRLARRPASTPRTPPSSR